MKAKRLILVVIGAGALGYGLARRSKAAKERSLSMTAAGSGGEGSLGVVEFETEGVDAEGNLVVDDLVVAVDGDGKIVASDETVAVLTQRVTPSSTKSCRWWETTASSTPSKKTSPSRKATSRAPKLSPSDRGRNGQARRSGAPGLSVRFQYLSLSS